MSSDEYEPKAPKVDLSELLRDISESAKSIKTSANNEALQERIDALELLVEEYGQARELQSELRAYVRDLREELADIRNFRWWVTAFAWLVSVGMFSLVFAMIVSSPAWFEGLDGKLQVPLIIALISGSVLLMVILLKGVYRSRHERNMGDVMPEALKIAYETFKSS